MGSQVFDSCNAGRLLDTLSGSHLHWSDFRDNILPAFRIQFRDAKTITQLLPTTFLARLQVFQGRLAKYEEQSQNWQAGSYTTHNPSTLPLLSVRLLGKQPSCAQTTRCTLARLSREGLPPRLTTEKTTIYELPTAKPSSLCGFSPEAFDKTEQAHLIGALTASGIKIDFDTGDVQQETICSPFLAFEQFESNSEHDLETARNLCAITGASMVRAQQQLFHKAYGLQAVHQNPVTFTCAFNAKQAIIHCHNIDEDGCYITTAVCKFTLALDNHLRSFLAWIDAIESWASMYLLLRIKGAINQTTHAMPSPPPSPPLMNTNLLSIDTSADILSHLVEQLQHIWPSVAWRTDAHIQETPLQSSIAQCGTPFPTRQHYGSLLLKSPDGASSPSSERSFVTPEDSSSSYSERLAPLRTDMPLSAISNARTSLHARRWSTMSMRSGLDGSSTPRSPCRPASLSPCSPGPEAPVSSRSPVLVLQKRLDVAMDEIHDLRSQVERLQGYIDQKIESIQHRFCVNSHKQNATERQQRPTEGTLESNEGIIRRLIQPEDDQRTPTANNPFLQHTHTSAGCQHSHMSGTSPTDFATSIPGSFDGQSPGDLDYLPNANLCLKLTLILGCLFMLMLDQRFMLGVAVSGILIYCCRNAVNADSS